jgi:hypothetical protein
MGALTVRSAKGAAAPLVVAWVLAACVPAASPGGPTVSLRMQGTPREASVTIDDEYVGPLEVVAVRGVALPLGKHRVTVEAPGYFPRDTIVEASSSPIRLDVRLVPVPD